ncbi:cyclic nucleotide-binding domain-containing protein [Actinomadura barringtoniae]|uniref:Cyclic nucleotide-binding domain-containing protein n=1 Tax=Actinomadura barringtoniae TaxID=1427535 RepID=A0A939PCN4_9ACTN|nr:family 2B encapsulin nanocompartment shell protein [Actinomadura barringtoniae]MBO2450165.1 cyclic nucleotide-binding domain-containing protein [Actinomadura barringtoniae]
MSVDAGTDPAQQPRERSQQPSSLGTAAARNLATTTKSVPQMQGISSRWLLRVLPWVQVSGGTYRVNRRLTYAVGGGRVTVAREGGEARVVPPSLREIPLFAGVTDDAVLAALSEGFEQEEVEAGASITDEGGRADRFFIVAHGRVDRIGTGEYGEGTRLGVEADGGYFGGEALTEEAPGWVHTVVAATATTLLSLTRQRFQELADRSPELGDQVERFRENAGKPQNRRGEADIEIASGHDGEPGIPGTFADYELSPREYELSVAQTVLRVHTRVADLYNEPMDQVEQQLRLTVEALRERQEDELVNNASFGLLNNVDYSQRLQTHSGPPTPDDMDELLTRRRGTRVFLAHPRAIAAFGRECNRRGLYPDAVEINGDRLPAWRGVPILPCNKIPITGGRTSTILAMRTGEDDQGVIGLHQIGIPDEYEPALNVRFMGINDQAVISYLVSAYYSAAVLVPDALGVLENVEISRPFS